MTFRALGRRAPDPQHAAASLKLGDYLKFRTVGLTPPDSIDHFSRISDWGMYGNDSYNDCGPTAAGNMRKMISLYVTQVEHSPSQDDIFALYRLQNPAFDINDPDGPGDQGVDLQTMCEDLVKVGIGGVKALGFASVNPSDLAELQESATLFGGLLLGVNLTRAQETQTNEGRPWDVIKGSPEWGRHAVLYGSYNQQLGFDISWAQAVGMTVRFQENDIEEAWAIIWPENLQIGAGRRGVDLPHLAADYKILTGRDFPVSIDPVPDQPVDPAPVPDPAPAPDVPPLSDFQQKLAEFLKNAQDEMDAAVQAAEAKAENAAAAALADVRPLVDAVLAAVAPLDAWLKEHGV